MELKVSNKRKLRKHALKMRSDIKRREGWTNERAREGEGEGKGDARGVGVEDTMN